MKSKPNTTNYELLRALTIKDAVGIGLGAIIGAGIFVVTGVAAGIAGPAFIIGLIIAGIIAALNGLSSAQLARIYPQSGGTYEYGYRLLHPALGFSAGWMFLISKLSAASIVAIGFGSYVYEFFPVFSPMIISVIAVIVLTAANYFGVKKAGLLNLLIVSITLLSLFYLIISGIPLIDMEHFKPFAPFGIAGIAESSALLFFAFTGYARIATLAEEVQEPEKTIPRAIIITIVSAIILYCAVSFIAISVIGSERMADSKSPLQALANNLTAPGIRAVTTIGASTAMLGVLLSQILGISRMMLAMGRRNDLPIMMQKIHKNYRIPHSAIILSGFIIILLTIAGNFEFIIRAASFTILMYYSITNIAALVQPREEQIYGRIVPALGLAGCLSMSAFLPLSVIFTGISLLSVGFLIQFIFKRAKI